MARKCINLLTLKFQPNGFWTKTLKFSEDIFMKRIVNQIEYNINLERRREGEISETQVSRKFPRLNVHYLYRSWNLTNSIMSWYWNIKRSTFKLSSHYRNIILYTDRYCFLLKYYKMYCARTLSLWIRS